MKTSGKLLQTVKLGSATAQDGRLQERTGQAVPGAQAAGIVAQVVGGQGSHTLGDLRAPVFQAQALAKFQGGIHIRLEDVQQPVQAAMNMCMHIAPYLRTHCSLS